MLQQELVKQVVRVLDDSGIDYMVTGSWASSLQGEPRLTHDIDLVVSISVDDIPKLLQAFPPSDYYLSEQAIQEAIQNKSMFNLLSLKDGDKADFWMLTDEPFNLSRFARKRNIDFEGLTLKVSAPEDTILAKLRWAALLGGSEKQLSDGVVFMKSSIPNWITITWNIGLNSLVLKRIGSNFRQKRRFPDGRQ